MTIKQIQKEVSSTKPVSRRQLFRYLRTLEIKPVGRLQQKPQHYPENTPNLILAELGLSALGAKVVSMPRLRRERARVRKARAA